MLNAWREWCRLCAKERGNEVNIFTNDSQLELLEIIHKHFQITISLYDEPPRLICKNCLKFLLKLVQFSDRCTKVETLLTEIFYNKVDILPAELATLKVQFGLEEYPPQWSNVDQATDTSDLQGDLLDQQEVKEVIVSVIYNDENDSKSSDIIDESEEISFRVNPIDVKDEECTETELEPTKVDRMLAIECDEEAAKEIDNDDEDTDIMSLLKIQKIEKEKLQPLEKTRRKHNGTRKNSRETKKSSADIFECLECDETFNRKREFQKHMADHKTNNRNKFTCSICPKTFPTERRAQLHEAVHLPRELKNLFPCPYCDKKFTKTVNVQAHVRAIHIGEKPFICEECGKAFGTNGALKEHKYTHIEDTPFKCSQCPKMFKNSARLKTHEDTHKDTIYVCPHCGLQLNTKRTLTMHMVVHSDQKKYKCNFCGNEYKRSKALKNHLILHTGLRPYLCPFCDKTFANGSNCRSHKKKAHPQELAAMEASGETQRVTNIPKLEQLKAQSKRPTSSPVLDVDKLSSDLDSCPPMNSNQFSRWQSKNSSRNNLNVPYATNSSSAEDQESLQQQIFEHLQEALDS